MPSPLGVGILGAGDVAQTVHLPVLQLLSRLYNVESVCDISQKNADHCAVKFRIPQATTNASVLFNNPAVDVVFILAPDEFHETYCIDALKAGKHVMMEKPVSLSIPSVKRIIEAEKASSAKVFVGYMRRYAPSFVQAFKRELATIPRILYARVRDMCGPNAKFISQSGTEPVRNLDFPGNAAQESDDALNKLFAEAFEGTAVTPEKEKYCRFLGSLASHDISLMREALGFPESIGAVSVNHPFYSAIFHYKNPSGEPYAVTYESGIDSVPNFDAHLAVYGEKKRIEIRYDSPFVKGLPIYVKIDETNEAGEIQSREILSSYEDAYTAELKEMFECLTAGKAIKTTVEDALNDLILFDMMYKNYEKTLN